MQSIAKKCALHLPVVMIAIVVFLFFAAPLTMAQTNSINRPYQPMILKGNSFTEFSNNTAAVKELFVYKYTIATNFWEQIPFQVDEVEPDSLDATKTTYFRRGDGKFDDQDELVFMARDAGDKAPAAAWINDASSRSFIRYEIALADPLAAGNLGYVYLFRSATLTVPPTVKDYVTYTPPPANSGSDVVKGQSYEEGHRINGINNSLLVPAGAGGSGTDFLDQLKLRFQVSVFGFNVPVTEEGFELQSIRLQDGNVRLIRRLNERISVLGTNLDFSIDVLYYGYSAVLATDLNITTNGVNLLRQSVDFESAVSGAKWYNQNITAPVTVDGAPDNLSAQNLAVVQAPNLNWYMLSSSHGSFITVFSLPAGFGSSQKFYYHDAPNNTADGTPDSGANPGSYGDCGLQITGTDIKGRFAITLTSYILAKDQARAVGETLFNQTLKPLTAQIGGLRVAVQEKSTIAPQHFVLLQNSPNPISASTPATVIRYELPFTANTSVSLRIFNVLGQNVRELVNATQPAGRYEVQWDGRLQNREFAPAGIYFYRLQAGSQIATQKLMILNR